MIVITHDNVGSLFVAIEWAIREEVGGFLFIKSEWGFRVILIEGGKEEEAAQRGKWVDFFSNSLPSISRFIQ